MTVNTDRAALAALATAAGLTGYPYQPSTPAAGDAWPRLTGLTREHGIVWRPTWDLLVGLDTDDQVAERWVDDNWLDLVAALEAQRVQVDSGEIATMPTDAGDLLVLKITVRTY